MASSLAQPTLHQRQPRPASASSSSVITVQRASSISSPRGSNARPVVTGLRSRSPNELILNSREASNNHIQLEQTKASPERKRRSSALYSPPDSRLTVNDGVANLNRWSQSTASSKSSAVHDRRSSFSKRLSGSLGTFGAFSSSQGHPSDTRPHVKSRSPPNTSPHGPSSTSQAPANPPPMLPPIVTLSSLTQAVDAAESPSTITTATPATADLLSYSANTTSPHDYFGDRWHSTSPQKPASRARRMSKPLSPTANPTSPLAYERPTSSSSSRPPESVYTARPSSRHKQSDRRSSQNAPNRSRVNSAKSTGTTEEESSASDHRRRSGRSQRRRAPSQKALLSKALAKANHAVVLDGRQNVEGAILAYGDACNLLRQVMVRSSGDDDRRKLEAVRNTYKNRIVELRSSDQSYQSSDNKALPKRPAERDSGNTERLSIVSDGEDEDIGTLKGRPVGHDSGYGSVHNNAQVETTTTGAPYIPPRRQSLQPSTRMVEAREGRASNEGQNLKLPRSKYSGSDRIMEGPSEFEEPMYQEYIPPHLSPRRPLSLVSMPQGGAKHISPDEELAQSDNVRQDNGEHTSWLNTINESSGSSSSSVHSRRSSIVLRRKLVRAASGQTEAEFDAALDAAIETAYDDGFEPDDEDEDDEQLMMDAGYHVAEPKSLSVIRRNVELAKENVREAEREAAIAVAKGAERRRLQASMSTKHSLDMDNGDDEADEEERMLEEMTRDYILDDVEFDAQTKPALPRQSDSSGFSGRTWGSIGSISTSIGTSLSPVVESSMMPSISAQLKENRLPPPTHPPPSGALPPPPNGNASKAIRETVVPPTRAPSLAVRNSSPGVRDRRLSGMKAKQLKIETNAKAPSSSISEAPKTQPPPFPIPTIPSEAVMEPPKSAFISPDVDEPVPDTAFKPIPTPEALQPARKISSPFIGSDEPVSATASALTKVTSADSDASIPSVPSSPARFASKAATGLRKNFSSSSLRNKALSLSGSEPFETSPAASVSSISSLPKQRKDSEPVVPVLPTPMESSFIPKGQPMGGIYLFDSDIHSPLSPGSPNPLATNAPLPLEPCPESPLLRPFWFLRSIYQTIAHPRGGYITSRLFIPRDIWRVKNIKLRNVEEKVSSCDLLTAALLKLAKVDTFDADAILEEMEFLESVMDQVKVNLTKKLGSDVGVQGAASLLKGSSATDENAYTLEAVTSKNTSSSINKSYLSSWRKLRSKNSLGPGPTSSSNLAALRDGMKEVPTMKSLPMTSIQNPRFPKRDVSQVQCMGPNPSYMGALARLCDAVQVLDQIARQVEDPGLKHSSPTHVGLELSTRHAAEFFSFYICRFVFVDIGVMLDKFIKRGSEWVLA